MKCMVSSKEELSLSRSDIDHKHERLKYTAEDSRIEGKKDENEEGKREEEEDKFRIARWRKKAIRGKVPKKLGRSDGPLC